MYEEANIAKKKDGIQGNKKKVVVDVEKLDVDDDDDTYVEEIEAEPTDLPINTANLRSDL